MPPATFLLTCPVVSCQGVKILKSDASPGGLSAKDDGPFLTERSDLKIASASAGLRILSVYASVSFCLTLIRSAIHMYRHLLCSKK